MELISTHLPDTLIVETARCCNERGTFLNGQQSKLCFAETF